MLGGIRVPYGFGILCLVIGFKKREKRLVPLPNELEVKTKQTQPTRILTLGAS